MLHVESVVLGRFLGFKNDKNSIFTLKSKNVILGIQEFQLTVHKENAIMGRFGHYICSTMKILLESSKATEISSDSKQKKCHFGEILESYVLTMKR